MQLAVNYSLSTSHKFKKKTKKSNPEVKNHLRDLPWNIAVGKVDLVSSEAWVIHILVIDLEIDTHIRFEAVDKKYVTQKLTFLKPYTLL